MMSIPRMSGARWRLASTCQIWTMHSRKWKSSRSTSTSATSTTASVSLIRTSERLRHRLWHRQSSGRDVELDMSVLHRHINQVIYDLELSEPVANAWRILQDGRLRNAFIESGKQPDFDALETWLKDVAEGELRSADFVGRASRM